MTGYGLLMAHLLPLFIRQHQNNPSHTHTHTHTQTQTSKHNTHVSPHAFASRWHAYQFPQLEVYALGSDSPP